MDLYTLDPTYLKNTLVEEYATLIWTERYNQYGEVTLTWGVGSPLDDLIVEDVLLYTPDSPDVMLIDTVNIESGVATATGQSLTGFLASRIFRNTWSTTSDSWVLTGVPGTLGLYIVQQMCMPGGIMAGSGVLPGGGANEVIPGLTSGPAAAGASISITVTYGNVYDAVKAVCDADNLGFRMYPPSVMDGSGALIFTTYRGADRTTDQSVNPPVIFEPALDNLTDVKTLRSKAGFKNVAYAWGNSMTAQSSIGVAYQPGANLLTGFQRRTLMVDASDVNAGDYTAANLQIALNQKAKDALANNNYVKMTDGTIVPQPNFVYGTDYFLGDVIELRGASNVAQQARITEFIRSKDPNGEFAYPTLSVI
jgi:hypothetical protein